MISKPVFTRRFSQPFFVQIVSGVLLCGLGYQLAVLTWRLGEMVFPQAQAPVLASKKPPAMQPTQISFNTLFPGQPEKQSPAATLSSLKVRLAAVIVSSTPEDSLVIIEQAGHQNSYGIQEVIDDTQASITAIQDDHVEVLNAGKQEILRLYDDAAPGTPAGQPGSRQQLLKEPKKLLEQVAITPVNKAGVIQGYRLNPGKEATLFQQSGLQPNDLAIAINGFDLRAPQEAAKFMAQLSELTQLDITVLRDDAEKNIFIDLAE